MYRQGLGYRDNNIRYLLSPLDQYVKDRQCNWESFKPNFFLDLRGKLKQDPTTINRIMSVVRGFFQFLVRQALITENPLQDVPSCTQRAYIPLCPSGKRA